MFKYLFFLTNKAFCEKIISSNDIENITVHFTSEDKNTPNTTNNIVNHINNAKNEILIQAYSFTSKPIMEALIDQYHRGIKIIIKIDSTCLNKGKKNKENATSKTINTLIDNGIDVQIIKKRRGLSHEKVMIIDQKIVITGSFNFTKAAQYDNSENLLIIPSKELAQSYINNFYK